MYRPHPVLACTLDGRHEPALCYIAADLALAPASAAYVARIVEPARRYGFPDWYVAHLESFAPA